MEQVVTLLLATILCLSTNEVLCQNNPCPKVFQYEGNFLQRYGLIKIVAPNEELINLKVTIATSGFVFNENSANLQLFKSEDETINDAINGNEIYFRLNFPASTMLPTVISIVLNDKEICNSSGDFNVEASSRIFTYTKTFSYSKTEYLAKSGKNPNFSSQNSQPDNPNFSFFFHTLPVTNLQANNFQSLGNIFSNSQLTPNRFFTLPQVPSNSFLSNQPVTQSSIQYLTNPTTTQITSTMKSTLDSITESQSDRLPNDASWLATYHLANDCGVSQNNLATKSTQLIIGGTPVSIGEYPWLVAIFHFIRQQGQLLREYKCGGTLISNRYVVTAAHCTTSQQRLYLELGRYDIANNDEDGYLIRNSQSIIRHPEYVSNTGHADIALVLIEPVKFTLKIQPICMWGFGLQFDRFINGTITGWGKTENGSGTSDVPMQLNVKIVNLEQCQNSNTLFRTIATQKTFCAGGNSTGPCHGDSGSGFYVYQRKHWYLRGIISISAGNEFVCNLSEYAVYVDISYYLDWLKSFLV